MSGSLTAGGSTGFPPLHAFVSALNEEISLMSTETLNDIEYTLHQTISNLRIARNSKLPIHTLPPEVLVRIFEDVVLCGRVDFRTIHGHVLQAIQNVTVLASVCCQWRKLALDCSRLWCHIAKFPTSTSPAYSEHVARRLRLSRSTPLRMSVNLPETGDHNTSGVAELLKSNSHRIQELYLGYGDDERSPFASQLLDAIDQPAPLLDLLVIVINRAYLNPWPSTPILFSDCAYNLRALAIQSPRSFYPDNGFQKLAHVRLSLTGPHLPTVQPLLHFLRNVPQVETLWIARCGGLREHEELDGSLPVQLLRLHSLSVTADVDTAFALLRCLDLPSFAKLHLQALPNPQANFTPYSDDPSPDHEGVPCLGSAPNVTSIDIMDYYRPVRRGRPYEEGHYITAHGEQSAIWMHLQSEAIYRVTDTLLLSLHQSLPLRHVTTARIALIRRRVPLLTPLLASMPSLTTLVLRGTQATTEGHELAVLDAIVKCLGATAESEDAGLVPAPKLVSLTIDADFAIPAGGLGPLVDVAAVRARAGSPLQELVFCAPGLEEEVLRPFEASVAVVRLEKAPGVLWPLRVDERWKLKNEYWRMYDEAAFEYFPKRWD